MNGDESQASLHRVLLDRFRSLEASHAKLKQQFDLIVQEQSLNKLRDEGTSDSEELTSYSGWGCVPGVFSTGSPYGSVLESMGHAVHVTRAATREIIYWNSSAEKLYGYRSYEVLGQRDPELLIGEEHYASAKEIMEKLRSGQAWSGQFPFRKRSGKRFMALLTKSPLYEDDEFVGVITVSSDAVVFNKMYSENLRTFQDHANGQPRVRGLNLKKIQWPPKPQIASVQHFASSVSNLAPKVLLRKRGDDTRNACTTSRDREESVLDAQDVTLEKAPKTPLVKPHFGLNTGKSTTDVGSSARDESTFEFVQPSKLAAKVLSKLRTGGIGNLGKDKDGSIQETGSNDISVSNEVTNGPNYSRHSKVITPCHSFVEVEREEANSWKGNSPSDAKRRYPNVNRQMIVTCIEEGFSVEAFPRECNECLEVPKPVGQLLISGFHFDAKELEPNFQNSKPAEMEDAVQQQAPQQFPSSGESISRGHESSSSKGENESSLIVDCEIRWEDLHLREEIGHGMRVFLPLYEDCGRYAGQGYTPITGSSYAIVYHGIWNGSDVAVKVYLGDQYSEEVLLDYKKEIDIMRRLRHPNVLLFMGAVYSQEKLAMVAELLPRGSLFKTLHRNNQSLGIRRRLRMALDVARGMNYLHHRNPPIIHRDLKSSNLLVDKNWTVKVGDFGLSKLKNATFLTAKSGRGTPQWMAPEVLRNEPSNEKSDVFSFGVVLWELITESIPWSNLNSLQVVGVVGFMDRRLDLPEGLDPRISSVIHDCWQSSLEQRPSFEDIIQTMTNLIQTIPGVSARRSSEP